MLSKPVNIDASMLQTWDKLRDSNDPDLHKFLSAQLRVIAAQIDLGQVAHIDGWDKPIATKPDFLEWVNRRYGPSIFQAAAEPQPVAPTSYSADGNPIDDSLRRDRIIGFAVLLALSIYWAAVLLWPIITDGVGKLSSRGSKLAIVMPLSSFVASFFVLARGPRLKFDEPKRDKPLMWITLLFFLVFPLFLGLHEVSGHRVPDNLWDICWPTSIAAGLALGAWQWIAMMRSGMVWFGCLIFSLMGFATGYLVGLTAFTIYGGM